MYLLVAPQLSPPAGGEGIGPAAHRFPAEIPTDFPFFPPFSPPIWGGGGTPPNWGKMGENRGFSSFLGKIVDFP